ncbi:hypothetical protein CLAIMM_13437 [Cladophialophora immunda]|nr:hypothetical protein CLAIMM_13437 [Cladophialophora immunda]
MKAHLLEKFNSPYELRDVPIPTIEQRDDILIRVDAASYCHTDAILASGAVSQPKLPHVGGHEFAGTVVALPSECTHDFKIGDRVAVAGRGYHACGSCLECRNPSGPDPDEPGFSVYCPHAGGGLGINEPGGFQEYALVDSRQVATIPTDLSATEVAPLMCAGLTVYAALVRCELRPGQRVGIIGCGGGLGHLGLQFATRMGLKTTGVDVAPQALELAAKLKTGAELVDASQEPAALVKQRLGQEDQRRHPAEMGLDAVLILPESQTSFNYGIDLVRNGGLVVVVSFPSEGFRVSAADLVFRRVRVVGSLIGSNKALQGMLDFCVQHGVRASVKAYPFTQLNKLVEDYHAGIAGKLVLDLSMKE